MELKYLKTIKTILETGSFQKAANKLNYTQSTITFQVQQLEEELSIKLFEKIGRKMILTQAGKDILPHIETILNECEQISHYGKDQSEFAGSLKIAMPETLLTYKMQPILKKFRNEAPNVKLSLKMMNCNDIRSEIINGSIDIAIHYDIGGYGKSIITDYLGSFELSLIASPDINKEELNFKKNQLHTTSLIVDDSPNIFQEKFNKYLREKNIVFDNLLEIGSVESVKRSVSSNLGIAYLPRFTVEEELKNNTLQEIKINMKDNQIKAILVYHKNKWISPAMKLFIDLSREIIL